ncbi:hypothetical protein MMC26_000037 [Xylographa opegraphella]|nr:hypothetical protein [Xylographa opegraphella]
MANGRWRQSAARVVLATNGYTNALLPALTATGFLVPARNQVAAVRPGSLIARPPRPLLRRSLSLRDRPTDDYLHARARGLRGAGDVLHGGGKNLSATGERGTTDDSVVHPAIAAYLHHAAARAVFGPERWGVEGAVVMDWTGVVAYTKDGLPLVGEVEEGEGAVGLEGGGREGEGGGRTGYKYGREIFRQNYLQDGIY